jgi:hypothetical protein
MKINSHFSELCLLPHEELLDYSRRVAALVELLSEKNSGAIQAPPVKPELPLDLGITPAKLPQRQPMRIPKPGSMRDFVHAALRRTARPMKRAEVIDAVAAERGLMIDDLLKAKISDALSNRHDPYVRKVSQGVYAYATPDTTQTYANEEVLCL